MKITSAKVPIDILFCFVLSFILLPVVLFNLNNTFQLIIGIPFLFFVPGYIIIFILFPFKRTNKGIRLIERLILSMGISIAIVPLIGLILNYTRWGIRLETVLFSIFIFVICSGFIALYRWYSLKPKYRFIISIDLTFKKSKSKIETIFTIILIASIIISVLSVIYVIF